MLAQQIIDGLNAAELNGAAAQQAARSGFLEWVLSLPEGENTRNAAAIALGRIGDPVSADCAVDAFMDLLRHAAMGEGMVAMRRGGARGRRRLH